MNKQIILIGGIIAGVILIIIGLLVVLDRGSGDQVYDVQESPTRESLTQEDSIKSEGLKAVILGSGGPIYNSERNGPSVLISNGEDNILVDMGNGTQAGLDEVNINIKSLSGLFLTHHHLDHNEELVPIFIKSLVSGSKFIVAGPRGTQDFISTNENLYAEDIAYRLEKTKRTTGDVKGNYEVKDLEGGESFSQAGMEISTTEVNHTIHTVAYRFDVGGESVVVSGDLTYSSSLAVLAKDANVLIIDSGSVVKEGEDAKNNQKKKGGQAHASLDEVGRMARDANVKTLVLTHFSPDGVDEEATKEAIAENFDGEIIFARDFMEIYPSRSVSREATKLDERKSKDNQLPPKDTAEDVAVKPITESPSEEVEESTPQSTASLTFRIPDTGVVSYYNNNSVISAPSIGASFYGQDAQYSGAQPSYTNNGDSTITDNVTGLVWQRDMGEKITFDDAVTKANGLSLGGHNDWRVPSIKEMYSLILFTGQVKGAGAIEFFIDTKYFNQPLGDTSNGEREIDAQTWTSTEYVGRTMGNDQTVFGVNFVDGRIKGYPKYNKRTQAASKMYFRLVRGNSAYGTNNFVDNGNQTITDNATGLTWTKSDSGVGKNWQEALSYCESLTIGGESDWRLPNTKELQGIVDYSRSPQTTNSAAINPIFNISSIIDPNGAKNYPFFWTGTTHLDGIDPEAGAAYVCFGECQGEMNDVLVDVHGAGAQRSDPKSGNISDYPQYFGPQGDIRYVYNYARCVTN
jgi:ribonuclease BN (tRNA processing enzyme)